MKKNNFENNDDKVKLCKLKLQFSDEQETKLIDSQVPRIQI